MKKNLKIYHYISIIAVLSLIPIIILCGILASGVVEKGINLKSQHLNLVNHASDDVKSFIEQYTLAIDTLAKQTGEFKQLSTSEFRQVVEEVVRHYPEFTEIYLDSSSLILSTRTSMVDAEYSARKRNHLNTSFDPAKFKESNRPVISSRTKNVNGEDVIYIAVPLRSVEGYEGFLMGTINLQSFYQLLEKHKIYPSGYSVLVDSNNQVIIHPDYKNGNSDESLLPVLSALKINSKGTLEYFSPIYMRREIASYTRLDKLQWAMWVAAPLMEVMQPLYSALLITLFFIVLGILILMVIRYLLISNIASPLTLLNEASQELASGNLSYRVSLSSDVPLEMKHLSQQFNNMASNLQHTHGLLRKHSDELEIRIKERMEELLLKNKELEALYTVSSSANKTTSMTEFLTLTLRKVMRLFSAELGSVYLVKDNKEKTVYSINNIKCSEDNSNIYTNYISELSRRTLESGKEVLIKDIEGTKGNLEETLKNGSIRSVVSIPIWINENAIGAVSLGSKERGIFGQAECIALRAIASQLQVVASNISMFNANNEEHNTLMAIINSINEGLLIVDARGKILAVNPIFLDMFQIGKNECQNETFRNLLEYLSKKLHSTPSFIGIWDDFKKQRTFQRREFEVDLNGKKGYYLIQGFPVSTRQEFIGYGYVLRNITKDKEIDLLKSSILSTVSHELRTPLTTLRGTAESLLRKDVTWSEEDKNEFFHAIVEESERLRELIENIMDMSKIEAGSLNLDIHSTDIRRLIWRVARRFQQRYPTLDINIVTQEYLPFALIDEGRIDQVLSNLVENGIKYSSQNPVIIIETAYIPGHKMLSVAVIDQGIGIAPEYHKEIFSRFYRIDSPMTKKVGGSGVGLSIAKGIIDAHGGAIWVASEPEHGSRFVFTVPCE